MPGPWYDAEADPDSLDNFKVEVGDILEIGVKDDDGGDQGTTLLRVTSAPKPTKHGRWLKACASRQAMSISSVGQEMGHLDDADFHLCRKGYDDCRGTRSGGEENLHFVRVRQVSLSDLTNDKLPWLKEKGESRDERRSWLEQHKVETKRKGKDESSSSKAAQPARVTSLRARLKALEAELADEEDRTKRKKKNTKKNKQKKNKKRSKRDPPCATKDGPPDKDPVLMARRSGKRTRTAVAAARRGGASRSRSVRKHKRDRGPIGGPRGGLR
jgi:hypothetical protein